jgi:hypothetical protein
MLIRTGPSHVNITNAAPPANLPLRQAFRQPICAPEPKIHDITEKFLKASDGTINPRLKQCSSVPQEEDSGVVYLTWLLCTFSLLGTHNRTTEG